MAGFWRGKGGKQRPAVSADFAIAVRNISGRRRWSKLAEWLRPGQPVSRQIGIAR
jgi:hypothetical protein